MRIIRAGSRTFMATVGSARPATRRRARAFRARPCAAAVM